MTSYWTERANTLFELKWKKKKKSNYHAVICTCPILHWYILYIYYKLTPQVVVLWISRVQYHEIFRLLYFQNTKKKGGSVFIPFLWVTAYLTWPFCTFDAVSVRFVFNICQYLQYYITLNIILIYCQWSDLNREVKKNNLACIKCIIFWVTFLNLKQTTSSTATIC